MRIASYPCLVLLLLVSAVASAQPSATKPPLPAKPKPLAKKQSAREVLTARLWRIRTATYADGSVLEEALPGRLHIKLTGNSFALDTNYLSQEAHLVVSFRNDGTASLKTTLPGENQTHVATWALSADEKRLTLTRTPGRVTEYRIERLDSAHALLVIPPPTNPADDRPGRLAKLELVPQE